MAIPRSPRPNKSYPPHKERRQPADAIRGGREESDATTESAKSGDAAR